MKIGWYIKSNDELASFRYRTKIPINILSNLGYDVGLGIGDITIFQKHFNPSDVAGSRRACYGSGSQYDGHWPS